jgi:hypothetical protein
MRLVTIFLSLLLLSHPSHANDFDAHFAVVFADTDTTAKYGPVPIDRRIIAQSIDALADAGAKGIVLKFFLDRDRDKDGDMILARAMARLPVILQARIDDAEQTPNDLPTRFTIPLQADTAIKGDSGWIPVARFADNAHDICFADYQGMPLPVVETYRDRTVKSLLLCTLELATGNQAVIKPGKSVKIGDISHELDSLNRVSVSLDKQPALHYIPLHEVLENDDWASRVTGKLVILGYDGAQIHGIQTESGSIAAHRYFVYLLHDMLENEH